MNEPLLRENNPTETNLPSEGNNKNFIKYLWQGINLISLVNFFFQCISPVKKILESIRFLSIMLFVFPIAGITSEIVDFFSMFRRKLKFSWATLLKTTSSLLVISLNAIAIYYLTVGALAIAAPLGAVALAISTVKNSFIPWVKTRHARNQAQGKSDNEEYTKLKDKETSLRALTIKFFMMTAAATLCCFSSTIVAGIGLFAVCGVFSVAPGKISSAFGILGVVLCSVSFFHPPIAGLVVLGSFFVYSACQGIYKKCMPSLDIEQSTSINHMISSAYLPSPFSFAEARVVHNYTTNVSRGSHENSESYKACIL